MLKNIMRKYSCRRVAAALLFCAVLTCCTKPVDLATEQSAQISAAPSPDTTNHSNGDASTATTIASEAAPPNPEVASAERTVKYIIHLNHKPCDRVIYAEAADPPNYHVICYKKYGSAHEINYLLNGQSNDILKSW